MTDNDRAGSIREQTHRGGSAACSTAIVLRGANVLLVIHCITQVDEYGLVLSDESASNLPQPECSNLSVHAGTTHLIEASMKRSLSPT
jgi:hypothetical protein